jgi:hypothetical protein
MVATKLEFSYNDNKIFHKRKKCEKSHEAGLKLCPSPIQLLPQYSANANFADEGTLCRCQSP